MTNIVLQMQQSQEEFNFHSFMQPTYLLEITALIELSKISNN